MPTKSIFKTIHIRSREEVESLVKAIEKSRSDSGKTDEKAKNSRDVKGDEIRKVFADTEQAYKQGFENGWALALIRHMGVTDAEAREMLERLYEEHLYDDAQPYDEEKWSKITQKIEEWNGL